MFETIHAKTGSKKSSGLPPPVHEGKSAIWHLATVLSWFSDSNIREFDAALLEIGQVNMQCNLVKEVAGLDRGMSKRLKGLVV